MVSLDVKAAVRVRLTTALGDLVIEVYIERAPQTGGAFLRYIDEGRFKEAQFVRTVRLDNDHGAPRIRVVQAAIVPFDTPQLRVEHESTALTGIAHINGVVSLARGALGTASPASFFICIGAQPALDFGGKRVSDGLGFAAFARVIHGMKIVRRIHGQRTVDDSEDPCLKRQILAVPVAIHSIRRD
jgi:peptidyl-prolyl cis-trans isomerase A (cyclophilin A)